MILSNEADGGHNEDKEASDEAEHCQDLPIGQRVFMTSFSSLTSGDFVGMKSRIRDTSEKQEMILNSTSCVIKFNGLSHRQW